MQIGFVWMEMKAYGDGWDFWKSEDVCFKPAINMQTNIYWINGCALVEKLVSSVSGVFIWIKSSCGFIKEHTMNCNQPRPIVTCCS